MSSLMAPLLRKRNFSLKTFIYENTLNLLQSSSEEKPTTDPWAKIVYALSGAFKIVTGRGIKSRTKLV